MKYVEKYPSFHQKRIKYELCAKHSQWKEKKKPKFKCTPEACELAIAGTIMYVCMCLKWLETAWEMKLFHIYPPGGSLNWHVFPMYVKKKKL